MSRNSWKSIFTAGGGLRAGWRFALFAGFWLASGYILFPLVSLVHRFSATGFTAQDILAYKTADALYMISVSALLVRLERQRMSWFGFGLARGTLRLFLAGSLCAAAMVSLLLFIVARPVRLL